MKKVLHQADTRGHANHGWLKSYHSFSFAGYHNPDRMHFGVLRVLNDDLVAGGQGFGTHPHENMEIISIPLSGDLEHKDSMGNTKTIREGDIQVMSAGSGVLHSEYNPNPQKEVQFLQIWLFPREKNVAPRYDQVSTLDLATDNALYQILSPNPEEKGVWIHQDAWFHLGSFQVDKSLSYQIKKPGNGLYVFVLEGEANIDNQVLNRRDALGVWDTDQLEIEVKKGTRVLLMDLPMALN